MPDGEWLPTRVDIAPGSEALNLEDSPEEIQLLAARPERSEAVKLQVRTISLATAGNADNLLAVVKCSCFTCLRNQTESVHDHRPPSEEVQAASRFSSLQSRHSCYPALEWCLNML